MEGGGFPNRAHNEMTTAGFSALMVQQSVTYLIGGATEAQGLPQPFQACP